jgi:hypothetical protein
MYISFQCNNPIRHIKKCLHQQIYSKNTMSTHTIDTFLTQLNLSQYISIFQKQHVDIDVLECMDESDLYNFGVKDQSHRATIMQALKTAKQSVSQADEDCL